MAIYPHHHPIVIMIVLLERRRREMIRMRSSSSMVGTWGRIMILGIVGTSIVHRIGWGDAMLVCPLLLPEFIWMTGRRRRMFMWMLVLLRSIRRVGTHQ
jgi:hypothetical protein